MMLFKGTELCIVLGRVNHVSAALCFFAFYLFLLSPILICLARDRNIFNTITAPKAFLLFFWDFFLIACIFGQDKENASDRLTAVLKVQLDKASPFEH